MFKNNLSQLSFLLQGLFLPVFLSAGNAAHAQTIRAQPAPPEASHGSALPFQAQTQPAATVANATVQLEAHMIQGGPAIKSGLVWRIFAAKTDANNKLPLIARSDGGPAEFMLAPGDYLVHVAFGRANMTRHITLEAGKTLSEHMVLNAGGIKLNAVLPHSKINENQLKFSIYVNSDKNDQQSLIIANVKPETVVRLNAGLYHVVSNYGTENAVVRSDIRVEAGKLTEVTMQHRAAQVTLKLVRQEGSEALADTSWTIMNDSGDIVREAANAYAYMILAEGDYVAIAKNKDQIYQKEFSVSSGHDGEIEILAIPQNIADSESMD